MHLSQRELTRESFLLLAVAIVEQAADDVRRGKPNLQRDALQFFNGELYGAICNHYGLPQRRPFALVE